MIPLLTINAWVLYPYCLVDQPNFMDDMWKLINWKMVAKRLAAAKS